MASNTNNTRTDAPLEAEEELSPPAAAEDEPMVSLAQLLRRTIATGTPLYNSGHPAQCLQVYTQAARDSLDASDELGNSETGRLLQAALEQASRTPDNPAKGAWILRRCFDEILDAAEEEFDHENTENDNNNPSVASTSSSWQDEPTQTTTVDEKAQSLADTAYILRSGVVVTDYVLGEQLIKDTFPASAAVEQLTRLGLARSRDQAAQKCEMLRMAGLMVRVDDLDGDGDGTSYDNNTDIAFRDGTQLYRFPTDAELEQSLRMAASPQPPPNYDEHQQQTAVRRRAVQLTLESTKDDQRALFKEFPSRRRLSLAMHGGSISSRRSILAQEEHQQGLALVSLLNAVEPLLKIENRKYRFKTYNGSFVGSDAVTAMVEAGLAETRADAVAQLNRLLRVGLLHHVTHEHAFEDKKLFYRVTTASDIQIALDRQLVASSNVRDNDSSAIAEEGEDHPHDADDVDDNDLQWTAEQRIQHVALVQRYKQAGAAGLNVPEILNSFYGCPDESGWDMVDLENWRHNMKRWGFKTKKEQDDDMVNKLSPLAANIDPETWEPDEMWESPFGILAQIAIFDQVPRSAFRGTPDAFKWDQLAIRATKTAIAKGYFETAYESTLNQFLILLPLEHSESWEDQKLGVHLLLKLLSTVAIEDDGLSDYEIVKRLEFSKRLTTAFLEHAQVIAKFQRYPHRNRAQGRSTTLEERIWLASDLVPRWARSQNPSSNDDDDDDKKKKILQLPVIPLKRLTRR